MKQELFKQIQKTLERGETARAVFRSEEGVWVREWRQRERLILLGGGHIAQPLSQVGAMLDFQVVVVDDRPSFANALRFPGAQVICGDFAETVRALDVGAEDFVCVITRGHRYDGVCVRTLFSGKMPGYLGMIGSKRRVSALREQLLEEGFSKEQLERLCAPIGLDIGAQTTAEIAVAIAAQLIVYRRGACSRKSEGVLPTAQIDEGLLRALAAGGGTQVMALVVETQGSTPVKAGAMMAVDALARIHGTVGGGCGEAQVMQLARQIAGKPGQQIIWVDMTGDAAEEDGMVCGGRMRVLLESVEEA